MILYRLFQKNPASHYLYIDLVIDQIQSEFLDLQLPAWRPGRYELGNFAKNIKRVDVFNERDEVLSYTKLSKDKWRVTTAGAKSIKVTYSYFAAELNAGSCFADASQIYVNPVHCCLYVPERMQETHVIELCIPEDYVIACSLPIEGRKLTATNYDELVDSPFMASAGIQTAYYDCSGTRFYLHFNGECRPDFEKIKTDFKAFTQKQHEFWSDYPFDVYHFLFQIVPQKFYHGVEHTKNTVIALGPGYNLQHKSVYQELLGVSSHELFHAWNIKTIRPTEMLPYDFTGENYARTGFVYEGFTTYYGDKFLLSSAVFDQTQYFETLQERLLKHFHNFGRYNLSVADSSYDTWLDGYVPGAPYRKTNIYDEGALIAFLLDVRILQSTQNTASLRDVCRLLYQRFGKQNRGYTEQDVLQLVSEVCGTDQSAFFTDYVYTAADYEAALHPAFEYLGLELNWQASSNAAENFYGFKYTEQNGINRISQVVPYGPAWKAGLFAGDEIIGINEMPVRAGLGQWLQYFSESATCTVLAISSERLKNFTLKKNEKGAQYYRLPVIKVKDEPSQEQRAAWAAWLNL
jgi:predicted metalloprotease with PDZ domain